MPFRSGEHRIPLLCHTQEKLPRDIPCSIQDLRECRIFDIWCSGELYSVVPRVMSLASSFSTILASLHDHV